MLALVLSIDSMGISLMIALVWMLSIISMGVNDSISFKYSMGVNVYH